MVNCVDRRAATEGVVPVLERAVIADPLGNHWCPACGKTMLSVEDQSARPHMLWYGIACPGCGFRHTINAALGGASG